MVGTQLLPPLPPLPLSVYSSWVTRPHLATVAVIAIAGIAPHRPRSPAPVSPALAFLFTPSTENPSLGSSVAKHRCHRRQGCRRRRCRRALALPVAWVGVHDSRVWVWRSKEMEQRRGVGERKWRPCENPPFCCFIFILFFFFLYFATVIIILTQNKLHYLVNKV